MTMLSMILRPIRPRFPAGDASGPRHAPLSLGVAITAATQVSLLFARLCLGCRGLHLRHPGLHVARQRRHDPQHPFDEHELAAMMHLMLFDADDHVETRSGRRLSAGRHGLLACLAELPGPGIEATEGPRDVGRILAQNVELAGE